MSMEAYRVQQYALDQGVYRKHSILWIRCELYHIDRQQGYCARVILSGNDAYGDTLPPVVRSAEDMEALARKCERMVEVSHGKTSL